VAAALLLGACTSGDEDHAVDLVNNARRANGRAALATNVSLTITAQAWSQHMAETQKLVHRTRLSEGAPVGWRKLGENIAYASSVDGIQTAFMNSAGHKANILDPAFNNVGIGITRDANGRYWETQEFAACSSPAWRAAVRTDRTGSPAATPGSRYDDRSGPLAGAGSGAG
jgi:uncharacterized protein YkwD